MSLLNIYSTRASYVKETQQEESTTEKVFSWYVTNVAHLLNVPFSFYLFTVLSTSPSVLISL